MSSLAEQAQDAVEGVLADLSQGIEGAALDRLSILEGIVAGAIEAVDSVHGDHDLPWHAARELAGAVTDLQRAARRLRDAREVARRAAAVEGAST